MMFMAGISTLKMARTKDEDGGIYGIEGGRGLPSVRGFVFDDEMWACGKVLRVRES